MRRLVFPVACFCGLWTAASAQSVQRPSETGIASWYGAPYHGRPSASGEIYDQEKLTAAHRTLPFGTRVRVRRLDRDRSIVVRINDRGPFVKLCCRRSIGNDRWRCGAGHCGSGGDAANRSAEQFFLRHFVPQA
jgi:rare lipoprotein A (RlpA)-like double-psi beta-barrel protein